MGENKASEALRSILNAFGTRDSVILSRSDLYELAHKPDLAEFVMATIVWGYTSGGRGNNVADLMDHLDDLIQLLAEARTQPVGEWNPHYKKMVKSTKGIGLSTYTKFLNFLKAEVHGHLALILDDRIIRVASEGTWKELAPLAGLSKSNAVQSYPKYLMEMHRIANGLEVSPEALEFFLFEFGLTLKPRSN